MSLLDTLIAMMLFGMMVVAMSGIWLAHYRANAQSQNIMLATYLGRQIVEENIAKAPHEIVPVARGSVPPFQMRSMVDGKERVSEFEYAVAIQDWQPHIKNMIVKVWWRENSLQKELHLETLLFAP